MARNENNLTVLEQALCDQYFAMPVESRNPTAAYKLLKPGGNPNSASSTAGGIFRRKQVSSYIKKITKEMTVVLQEAAAYDMESCVQDLLVVKEMAMGRAPIGKTMVNINFGKVHKKGKLKGRRLDAEWVERDRYEVNLEQARKALELIGKHFGGFQDNLNVNLQGTVALLEVPADLSPEQWHKHFNQSVVSEQ